jgi:hypothetical protein
VENELLAEDGLAAPRHPDDQVDRVAEKTSVEDLV